MLDADEGSEVPYASTNVGVTPQYFDGAMRIGKSLARAGRIGVPVWDIYLFYPAGVRSTEDGLPFPERAIAQVGGVLIATPAAAPPRADQSRLDPAWKASMAVVGSQNQFPELLAKLAHQLAGR